VGPHYNFTDDRAIRADRPRFYPSGRTGNAPSPRPARLDARKAQELIVPFNGNGGLRTTTPTRRYRTKPEPTLELSEPQEVSRSTNAAQSR
jgi:hypothetical protein